MTYEGLKKALHDTKMSDVELTHYLRLVMDNPSDKVLQAIREQIMLEKLKEPNHKEMISIEQQKRDQQARMQKIFQTKRRGTTW